jgi:hypothetical protein
METLLIYLLKVSGILTIFYLAYQAFLIRETFYAINRHFLIAGLITALLLPFVSLTNYIEIEATPINLVAKETTLVSPFEEVQVFNWSGLLFAIYVLGFLFFTSKFIVQLVSLFKLVKRNTIAKKGKFYYVETHKNIAPFSFFNHIFYNPKLYSSSELSAILIHEEAHSSQWHSIDVILSYVVTISTWMNPFSWLYQNNIKQNLEFLADESATKEMPSIKKYQYTLLKVSGNQFFTPIVNNFYNSLIRLNVLGRTFSFNAQYGQVKKRIVMLNKSKSHKRNILKIALIIPVLAIFLVSFNTKDVYRPIENINTISLNTETSIKVIEITIDKNTTDEELSEIKKDLAKKGVDFSYTVVHNSKNEITDIKIDFAAKKENGKTMKSSSHFNNGDDPIDPIHIVYDENSNSISMGNAALMEIHEDDDVHINIHKDSDKAIWVHAANDGDEVKTIEIKEENGKETIRINGKKVSRKEYEAMKDKDVVHKKQIRIKKSGNDKDQNVFIMKMSDDDKDEDHDFEIKTVDISEENGKETIRVNGKKVTREEFDAMKDKDGIHEKRIKIIKSDNDKDKNVFIMKMSDEDDDEMDIEVISEEGNGFFFIDNDGGEKPIYIIDGKESTEEDMKSLDPSDIATINVYKGDKANEKFGDKGKDGVVEITTKNQE